MIYIEYTFLNILEWSHNQINSLYLNFRMQIEPESENQRRMLSWEEYEYSTPRVLVTR